MHLMQLLHRGSVKDIYKISRASAGDLVAATLLFRFSDRYSIFDWGQMPDAIPQKGAALAQMGMKILHHLDQKGFKTHYLGPGELPTDFHVRSVDVPRGNLEVYQSKPDSILVPLEVIYRFGAPKGSSLLRKLKSDADWKNAGYDRAYQEGEDFSKIHLDVTTKLERMDRALTDDQARDLAGMSLTEWNELIQVTTEIAQELKKIFADAGMKLWDGKLEFAFIRKPDGSRGFMLVDSVGLDEIRLTWKGIPLSKEILRQIYLRTPWYTALEEAKKKSPDDFRTYCETTLQQSPSPLPGEVLTATSTLYQTVAALILNPDESEKTKLRASLEECMRRLCASS